ncbi:HesA/MoeB/ThiF family protein [Gilvimarinus polysaccharolyticus]|uniref:HesA/MoeB/ThiF family protein n=1 Tax=Gilvimarinus polysaccharolyticus TaxID=863921 RepID=UPI0006736CAB|nr:molybdopterin-synthase adenylyltransferase MoeB [Gilvimarinus polysaccharolyticus]
MNDDQLLRYSRQIMLPGVDIEGQTALLDARVMIVGLGGLGAPVAMYLAAAGVGALVLVDDDVVELSNLQRQVIHHTGDIGQSKVASAAASIKAINPDVAVTTHCLRLSAANLTPLLDGVQVLLDCSDNFAIRFALNAAAVAHQIPLVSGAAIRLEGQVAVFDSRDPSSPCYRCLYDEQNDENLSCSESGVLAPLVGVIGSMQALETIKLLAGIGDGLTGRLQLYDARKSAWREMRLPRDPDCPVCKDRAYQ